MAINYQIIERDSNRSVFNDTGATILNGTFVKLATGGDNVPYVEVCGAGELAYGVLNTDTLSEVNGVEDQKYGTAAREGSVVEMEAAAVLAVGDIVASNAAGLPVVATTGDYILGQVTRGAASGDTALIQLQSNGLAA